MNVKWPMWKPGDLLVCSSCRKFKEPVKFMKSNRPTCLRRRGGRGYHCLDCHRGYHKPHPTKAENPAAHARRMEVQREYRRKKREEEAAA